MTGQKLLDNNRSEVKRILTWLAIFTAFDVLFIGAVDEGGMPFISGDVYFTFNLAIIIPIGFILVIMLLLNLSKSSQKHLSDFNSDLPISILIILVFDFLICTNIVRNDTSGWAGLAVISFQIIFFYPLVLILFLVYLGKRRGYKKRIKSRQNMFNREKSVTG